MSEAWLEIPDPEVGEGEIARVESVEVELSGDTFRLGVSGAMLGRVLDGRGRPIDDGPSIVPLRLADVNGGAINPASRDHPEDFIETGISRAHGFMAEEVVVDGAFRLNTERRRRAGG